MRQTPEFLTPLMVEQVRDGTWLVRDALAYRSIKADSIFVVPEGFHTDFASVPRLPFIYLIFGNTAHAAAVVHDYLYTTKQVSRKCADAVFLEAMGVLGMPRLKRWSMYVAVRIAGGNRYG